MVKLKNKTITSYKVVGAKAGSKPSQPNIADDTVSSLSLAKILYGLGEGEISGIVGGAKGIYLEDTPLEDDNGNKNFENVTYDFRSGTLEQEYIKGFPDVSNEIPVAVELKSSAWIKAITKPELSAVRIRLSWTGLKEQVLKSGDVKGYKIDYAIDVKTGSGAYVEVLKTFINDKVSGKYERTHRIDLPESSNGWQIRVRRLTPNANSELIQDKMYIESITEVIDIKLRYPNTALLGLQYDAKTFSRIAKIAVRAKGKIISVPTNYDTTTGLYSGLWNGTFKQAYSNNPAWIFYDILTNSRYGLGKRIDSSMVDKWALYSLGVYCDELIDDGSGNGTKEKRYSCNVYLQSQQDAFTVLQQLAGIFKAITYWNGEQIVLDADVPQDPVYTFSRANVIDGNFEYTGTRLRDRHTVAKVAFDNPNEGFKTEYEYIRDEAGIAKFGINIVDISAIGCTSRGQAQRAGLWALKSEQLETRTVSFSTGLEGFIPQVGNIIEVSDELLAGRANGGRISKVQSKVITLDRSLTIKVNDYLVINGTDGISESRKVTNVNDKVITVASAYTKAVEGAVFAIRSEDLNTMLFRVMSIKPDDNKFNISAIQHEPLKYEAIDFGADVKPTNITTLKPINVVEAPATVSVSATYKVVQGQNVATMIIQWSQVKDAVSYRVEWRKDNGNWIAAPATGNVSLEVTGVYAGNYLARVIAVSAFDVSSNATTSTLTEIKGKVGAPKALASISATGLLFGMALSWNFQAGSEDTAYTEIETATNASGANTATLGSFSYPTNKTELTGLQGGLKVYYRGRIVDKLGNFSSWSNWVSGTTEADAAKVLDLLTGQITESQLYTDLSTKINQIDINKSAIEDIDFTEVNEGIAAAEAEIVQAKTDITKAKADIINARSKADAAKLLADANKLTLIDINETVGDNKVAVEQSITNLVNEDIALNSLYTNLSSEYGTNKAKVVQDLKTLTDKDISLSELLTNLDSDYKGNKANVSQSLTALTNKDTSLTNSITSLTTKTGNNETAISDETTARSNADSALSTRISTNLSKADNALGRITATENTIASHTQAIASTENKVEANFTLVKNGHNNKFLNSTLQQFPNTKVFKKENHGLTICASSADRTIFRLNNVIDSAGYWTITFKAKCAGDRPLYIDVLDQGDTVTPNAVNQKWSKVDVTTELKAFSVTIKAEAFGSYNFVDFTTETGYQFDIYDLVIFKNSYAATIENSSEIKRVDLVASNAQESIGKTETKLLAEFNNLTVGGRNLVLKSTDSDLTDTGSRYPTLSLDRTFNDLGIKFITISCFVDVRGAVLDDGTGLFNEKYNRAGVELRIIDDNGNGKFYGKFHSLVAGDFTGKLAKTIDVIKEGIGNYKFNNVLVHLSTKSVTTGIVKDIKVETGNKASDWSLAPEDVNSSIEANTVEIERVDLVASNAKEAIGKTETKLLAEYGKLKIGARNLYHKGLYKTASGGIEKGYIEDNTTRGINFKSTNNDLTIFRIYDIVKSSDVYATISGYISSTLADRTVYIDVADRGAVTETGSRSWSRVDNVGTVPKYFEVTIDHSSTAGTWLDFSTTSAAIFTITDLKVETGNKATDWTPAPEDVEKAIVSNKAGIERIDVVVSRIDGSLASTVENLTATTKSLNNLEIGGTNLLRNSDFKKGFYSWGKADIFPNSYLGLTNHRVVNTVANTNFGIYVGADYRQTTIVEGRTYTLSFYAKGTISSLNYIYLKADGKSDFKLPTISPIDGGLLTPRKITFVAPWTSSDAWVLLATGGEPVGANFEFGGLKLERGNIATEWSPSPADVEIALKENTASIEAIKEVNTNQDSALSNTTNTLTASIDGLKLGSSNRFINASIRRVSGVGTVKLNTKYGLDFSNGDTSVNTYRIDNITDGSDGYWTISFKAYCDLDRPLYIDIGDVGAEAEPNSNRTWTKVDLTPTLKSYSVTLYGKANKWLDFSLTTGAFMQLQDIVITKDAYAAIREEKTARVSELGAVTESVTTLETKLDRTGKLITDVGNFPKGWTASGGKDKSAYYSTYYQAAINTSPNLGKDSGYNGEGWYVSDESVKVNRHLVYKLTAETIITRGDGATYIGLVSYNAAGQPVSKSGYVGAISNAWYAGWYNRAQNAGWRKWVVYYSFNQSALDAIETDDIKVLLTDSEDTIEKRIETLRPLWLSNYGGEYGYSALKYFTVEALDAESEAKIQQSFKTVDGLSAQTTLKLDVNGYVSGMGQYNNGTTSQFAVRADNFYIANPSSKTTSIPFQVLTSATTVNGVSVPAGTYVKDAFISNGSISNAKIGNAAITTAKIGNLAVDTAQIATGAIDNAKIANAAITSAKIGNAQVDTLQIAGEAVTVPRAVSSVLTQVGDNQDSVELEVFRTTMNSLGSAVIINFGFTSLTVAQQNYANPRAEIKIYRDSVVIHEMILYSNISDGSTSRGMSYAYLNIPSVIDNPSSGNRIYKVTIKSFGLNSNDMFLRGTALTLFGAKR